MRVKQLLATGAAAAVMFGSIAVPAFATYGTQPGFTQAQSETQCSGAGAFGAFGEHGDIAHDFSGGANGPATGYNNSNLCGNPQGNP